MRWSADVDVFHDVEDAVMRASVADLATLEAAGYTTRQDLWTPSFRRAWVSLLDQMRRNARVSTAQLREMGASFEPQELKTRWIGLADVAEPEIERAGTLGLEVGLAFVHADFTVGWFDDAGAVPHRATLGGATPRIVE